jgi:hypothetical protein
MLLSLVNVSVINSLNSLELKSEQTFQSNLRMTVSKTISCPTNFINVSELFIHPVHTNCILVKNIFIIANGFVILYPTAVGNVDLTIFQKFFYSLFLTFRNIFIPIFEENNLCNKIFSSGIFN